MSKGRLLQGQQYDPTDGVIARFTEQMVDNDTINTDVIGDAATDVIPGDHESSKVRIWSLPPNGIDSFYFAFPGTRSIVFPAVLTGITITYAKSENDGESIHDVGNAAWAGSSGGMDLHPNATAQGSASIIPDIQPNYDEPFAANVPTTEFLFYVAGNTADQTAIITRLQSILTLAVTSVVAGVVTTASAHGLSVNQPFQFATVVGGSGGITALTTYYVKTVPTTTTFTYSATVGGAALAGHAATSGTEYPVVARWPVFRPKPHTFTLKGEDLTLSQQADSRVQYSWSASNVSYAISPWNATPTRSDGVSRNGTVTVRTVRIPPTIHGAITLSSTSDTATVNVEVTANVPAITGTGGAPSFTAVINEPTPLTETVSASVTPTSLSATSGATSIPTAGLFIYDVAGDLYKWGYGRVRVTVVDMSYFA